MKIKQISKIKNRLGEIHTTNEGYKVEIIEYFGCENCTVKFEDGTIIKNRQYYSIVNGTIKNPYHKSSYNEGYFGVGKYSSKSHNKIHSTWQTMLQRCYDVKVHVRRPTYIGVTVCEEWKCFQNFAEWMEQKYNPETMQGWHLDKDILIKGNKVYSPETCRFIPHKLNKILNNNKNARGDCPIGVSKNRNKYEVYVAKNGKNIWYGSFDTPEEAFQAYKIAKENYIKETAEEWKNKLDIKVYNTLINYKVEIDD